MFSLGKDYVLRPATVKDAPGITRVAFYTWNATYAHSVAFHNRQEFLAQAYAPQALQESINQAYSWFYVAIQGSAVVGFAQYVRRFDAQGELVRIYVHPDHQRRGIGRAFLGIGLAAMAEAGISHCHVSVEINNRAGRSFYEHFGFRRRREYGQFLGDQLIRLVEYVGPVASLLEIPEIKQIVQKHKEQT